jgi:hypothetical protein
MAEPITYYDHEFLFTSGDPLYFTVQEGKDAIDERPDVLIYTLYGDDAEERIEVYREKVNCRRCIKRIVKPEPRQHGDTILELS